MFTPRSTALPTIVPDGDSGVGVGCAELSSGNNDSESLVRCPMRDLTRSTSRKEIGEINRLDSFTLLRLSFVLGAMVAGKVGSFGPFL